MLQGLQTAKEQGANLAVFPECAMTGYHIKMEEKISWESLHSALEKVRLQCATLQMNAVVGCPFYGDVFQEKNWNAVITIDDTGEIVPVTAKELFMLGELKHNVMPQVNRVHVECFRF